MRPKKKNKFFTFIFSFIPGAAEMYLGFLKNGGSLMVLFFLSVALAFSSQVEVFYLLTAGIWFFCFFHARNYANTTEEEFYSLSDRPVWEELTGREVFRFKSASGRKWAAVLLIVIGAFSLWRYLSYMVLELIPDELWDQVYPMVDRLPNMAVSVLFIVIGVWMIAGKKKELDRSKEEPDTVRGCGAGELRDRHPDGQIQIDAGGMKEEEEDGANENA